MNLSKRMFPHNRANRLKTTTLKRKAAELFRCNDNITRLKVVIILPIAGKVSTICVV